MQDVKVTVHRLDKTMNDNYQEILSRLRALEMPRSPSQQSQSPISEASETIRISDSGEKGQVKNLAHRHQRSSKVFNFVFESELAISKVYRKVKFGGSTTSLLTTEDPKTNWSVLSAPSIADVVSSLSVLNLAITTSDVYNAAQYRSDDVDASDSAARNPGNDFLVWRVEPGIYVSYEVSIDEIKWIERLSHASYQFFQGLDSSWIKSSCMELIPRIFTSLNLPLSIIDKLGPKLYMDFLPDPTHTAWERWAKKLTDNKKPLELFTLWRKRGCQPVLLLSVAKHFYLRRDKPFKPHEVGHMVDGWFIDAELLHLSQAHQQKQPVNSE